VYRSARFTMMVFALGMSSPFSTMVVATQDVELVRDESHHHALELVFAQLACPTAIRASGTRRVTRCDRVNGLDAVVPKEDLATSLELGPESPGRRHLNRT
jgi:hypothetical protein